MGSFFFFFDLGKACLLLAYGIISHVIFYIISIEDCYNFLLLHRPFRWPVGKK